MKTLVAILCMAIGACTLTSHAMANNMNRLYNHADFYSDASFVGDDAQKMFGLLKTLGINPSANRTEEVYGVESFSCAKDGSTNNQLACMWKATKSSPIVEQQAEADSTLEQIYALLVKHGALAVGGYPGNYKTFPISISYCHIAASGGYLCVVNYDLGYSGRIFTTDSTRADAANNFMDQLVINEVASPITNEAKMQVYTVDNIACVYGARGTAGYCDVTVAGKSWRRWNAGNIMGALAYLQLNGNGAVSPIIATRKLICSRSAPAAADAVCEITEIGVDARIGN